MKIAKGLLVTAILTGVPLVGSLQTNAAPPPVVVQKDVAQQTLNETVRLAKVGRVINSEQFGVGSTKSAIMKKWGNPEESTKEYVNYTKRKVAFSLKQGKVVNVTTTDKRVLAISYDALNKKLGKPVEEDHAMGGRHHQVFKVGRYYIEVWWKADMVDDKWGEYKLQYLEVTKDYKLQ